MTDEANIVICPDTNILVEFLSLRQLRWREAFPDVEEIKIVIPATVANEMDNHKTKSGGRLRKRGMEFNQLAREIENSQDEILVLSKSSPVVSVSIGEVYLSRHLDGENFDLADNDSRILAEVAKLAAHEPAVIFLSDDAKPLRLARQVKLRCLRPPNSWRREEPPDEKDAKIDELTRQLGARPNLGGHFSETDEKTARYYCECAMPVDDKYKTDFSLAMEQAVPLVSREESIRKYGLDNSPSFMPVSISGSRITYDQMEEYEAEYKDFQSRTMSLAMELPTILAAQIPVTLEVENSGTAAAYGVHVVLQVKGDFQIVDAVELSEKIEEYLNPPSAPAPLYARIGNIEPDLPKRADWFYPHDEVEIHDNADTASWRCEEFRQGTRHPLELLVKPTCPDAKGVVHVTITSPTLASSVQFSATLQLPEKLSTIPARKYVQRRLIAMPEKYADYLEKSLQ